jgi:DNA-binding response OmpR family regulator
MYIFKPNGAAPKILIADDDPCVLRAVADRCVRMGFDVETASSGLQALIKAGQRKPDILVLDVHMPEGDGLSVCAFLLEAAKASPHVLVMTGHPDQEIAERKRSNRRCLHPQGT